MPDLITTLSLSRNQEVFTVDSLILANTINTGSLTGTIEVNTAMDGGIVDNQTMSFTEEFFIEELIDGKVFISATIAEVINPLDSLMLVTRINTANIVDTVLVSSSIIANNFNTANVYEYVTVNSSCSGQVVNIARLVESLFVTDSISAKPYSRALIAEVITPITTIINAKIRQVANITDNVVVSTAMVGSHSVIALLSESVTVSSSISAYSYNRAFVSEVLEISSAIDAFRRNSYIDLNVDIVLATEVRADVAEYVPDYSFVVPRPRNTQQPLLREDNSSSTVFNSTVTEVVTVDSVIL